MTFLFVALGLAISFALGAFLALLYVTPAVLLAGQHMTECGGEGSPVFNALRRILKVLEIMEERIMSQGEDLRNAVTAVDTKLDEVRDSVQRVIDLLSQPNPDVQAAIEQLGNVLGEAQGVKESLDGIAPPPGEEPPPSE